MRFQVPQFIEVEDKIFGPLTLKQFIYLLGGLALGFICIKLLPIYIGILPALAFLALGVTLAFYKVNNRPFMFVLENGFKFMLSKKLYLWRKEQKKIKPNTEAAKEEAEAESLLNIPRLSDSRLKDMTWSLDVASESLNPVTRNEDDRSKKLPQGHISSRLPG